MINSKNKKISTKLTVLLELLIKGDGQDIYELKKDESVKIKIANQKSKLIRAKERDYFSVLNQKLNRGTLPRKKW
ncbi:MAG: hypothetical protein RBT59_06405 [Arcobacteraceae bacterium]|jgi:NAD+ kinase|nr:hypothetical protein [Arcobacteraceae bacterium]